MAIVPKLVTIWSNVLVSSPKISVFGLDMGLSLVTIAILSTIRWFAERAMEDVWGWPTGTARIPSSSVSSIFHSTLLCPGLVAALMSQPYAPHAKLSVAPTEWQNAVTALLQFCTGYMIYDGLINIILLKSSFFNSGNNNSDGLILEDYLFLGHHLATAGYMLTARIVQAGHQSAMMCMFLGECTNPLQNTHLIALAAANLDVFRDSALTAWAQTVVSAVFAACYVLLRAVICPSVAVHMTYDLWRYGRSKGGVPIPLIGVWTILIWAVLIGSIPWIQECWTMLDPYKPDSMRGEAAGEL